MAKNTKIKFPSKKINLAVAAIAAVGLAVASLLLVPGKAAFANSTLYFARGSGSSGTTLFVQVRAYITPETADSVQADFTYPAANLSFVGFSASGSGFEIEASQTGGSGTVSIARGTTTPKTGDQLVATVQFTVNGTAALTTLSFQNSSVFLNGGDNILDSKSSSKFFGITGPVKKIYRLWNSINNDRLLTTSDNEKNTLTTKHAGWKYEGTAFSIVPHSGSGAKPMYRLWNSVNNDRLLTTDLNEKNTLTSNLPEWKYEGIAFYAVPSGVTGSVPVYRLWNSINNDRLLTTSTNERNTLTSKYPGWRYEGVAFYVAP